MNKKAIIAMSGGVDSSVAAYLMVQQGYDCAGATLKLYDNPQCSYPGHRACCTPSDTEDARSVAARLGMLYYVFPMQEKFHESVIDKFADTYLHGGTPNPCIDCNRFLKFSALLDKARELGCEYIASGHYARREQDPETGRFILKKGLDPTKDQSYVLYAMTQDQLAHTLFPLGSYTKKEIRHIAQEQGFINADKPDSQDICFVPDHDYASFITQETGKESKPGNFVDEEGNIMGQHRGLIHYTIGQRKGLGISSSTPIFVKELRPQTNEVVLCKSESLFSRDCHVDNINYMAEEKLTGPVKAIGKIRYSHAGAPCTLYPQPDGTLLAQFDEPQRAMTPGQAAVFYQDDHVLCGGTIETE